MTTRFEGVHAHALTNTLFTYKCELLQERAGWTQWRAEVMFGGKNVGTFSGETAFDPTVGDAVRAATAAVHSRIDARDDQILAAGGT